MTTANPNLDLRSVSIAPVNNKDSVKGFRCGAPSIDNWVCDKGYKHHSNDRVRLFCASLKGSNKATGFYCLSFSAEESKYLFEQHADRYLEGRAPFIYINYLAVQKPMQNQRIGTLMLMNALRQSYAVSKTVAIYGVALRPLNERVRRKYERHGLVVREDVDNPLMILPIWHLRDLFDGPPPIDRG